MSKKRRKFQCWIGNHFPKKITEPLYVKDDDEFSNSAEPMVGTACTVCGHIGLKRLHGHYSWRTYEEISREEALEKTKRYIDEAKHKEKE